MRSGRAPPGRRGPARGTQKASCRRHRDGDGMEARAADQLMLVGIEAATWWEHPCGTGRTRLQRQAAGSFPMEKRRRGGSRSHQGKARQEPSPQLGEPCGVNQSVKFRTNQER